MKSGWVTKRLGEVCEEVRERIASSSIDARQYVGTENMLKECAGIVDAEAVPKDVGLVRYLEGDVLLSNIRPYLKKVWLSDREGGSSSDVIVFRARPGIDSAYVQRVLSQNLFFDYSMLKVSGAKMPRGNRDWIKSFEFSFPESLSEQRRIVAKIDAAFAKIDRLKANAEKNRTNAKELFQSALNEAMRPKPGWVEKRLNEVFNFIDYRGKTPTKITSGVPLITAKNIRMGYLDYSCKDFISEEEFETRKSRGIARKGDLLFTTEAPLGFVAMADKEVFSTGQRVITFQQYRKSSFAVLNRFYFYYLQSARFQDEVKRLATGATAQGIKASRLKDIKVDLPPIDEQTKIAQGLDVLSKSCATLQQNYTRLIADCAEMRQAVLKEAFEGKL